MNAWRKLGILLCFPLFMWQCSFKKPVDCDKINEESLHFIDRYNQYKVQQDLDSALFYTNKGLKNCKEYEGLFLMRKLVIYSLGERYSEGIELLSKLGKDVLFPCYHKVLVFRFKIMKAIYEQRINEKDKLLKECILLLNNFLLEKKNELDSLFNQSDFGVILSNPLSTLVTQYYYYKSLVNVKQTKEELMRKKHFNNEFREYLFSFFEDDIMKFKGF